MLSQSISAWCLSIRPGHIYLKGAVDNCCCSNKNQVADKIIMAWYLWHVHVQDVITSCYKWIRVPEFDRTNSSFYRNIWDLWQIVISDRAGDEIVITIVTTWPASPLMWAHLVVSMIQFSVLSSSKEDGNMARVLSARLSTASAITRSCCVQNFYRHVGCLM